MLNQIRSVLNQINPTPGRKLKILTCPTHEGWQTLIDKTGHEFYMIQGAGIKPWDFHTRQLPPNHYLLELDAAQYRGDIQPDLILSQDRYHQLQRALGLQQNLKIPVVHIDHTEPPPGIGQKRLDKLKAMRADYHVYITEHNKNSWQDPDGIVIPHGIDTEVFNGWQGTEDYGISVVNHFASRDVFCGWNLWQEIGKSVPLKLIGENPGLSKSVSNTTELASEIGKAKFFLNTSQYSPVPMSLLEAAACGAPIVTTPHQMIKSIFTHNVNALISEDKDELIMFCKKLLEDEKLRARLGLAARNLILEKFNISQFTENWNRVFAQISGIY